MQLQFPSRRRNNLFIVLGTLLVSTSLAAQWVKYPTAGVPRKADGSVNMAAPTPRMSDGKPDFSGVWMTGEPNRPAAGALGPINGAAAGAAPIADDKPGDSKAITASRQMTSIGVDIPGGLPYQPWLIPIVKERTANNAIDDPHIKCLPDNFLRAYGLPHLLKFVHVPGLLVVLNEMNAGYRQVFTDARPLPEAAKVREQIRRPDFGHLEIQVTVNDPKAYTKPWTINLKQRIVVDTDLIDEICLENEKFLQHAK